MFIHWTDAYWALTLCWQCFSEHTAFNSSGTSLREAWSLGGFLIVVYGWCKTVYNQMNSLFACEWSISWGSVVIASQPIFPSAGFSSPHSLSGQSLKAWPQQLPAPGLCDSASWEDLICVTFFFIFSARSSHVLPPQWKCGEKYSLWPGRETPIGEHSQCPSWCPFQTSRRDIRWASGYMNAYFRAYVQTGERNLGWYLKTNTRWHPLILEDRQRRGVRTELWACKHLEISEMRKTQKRRLRS